MGRLWEMQLAASISTAVRCNDAAKTRMSRLDEKNDSIIDNTDNSIEIVVIDNYEYENTAST